ncbi:cytochrome c-type protein NrfB precursor [mine drainage metagenome]|uniref:Cytochrome c-type protein NrfB n=1 Tax=mine drainage metagenome TaxID=410659 RepID=A0A1J5S481_9ZZZZ
MKLLNKTLAICAVASIFFCAGSASGADNPTSAPNKQVFKDVVLRGDARCTSCHDEGDSPEVLRIGKTRHGVTGDARTPSCTSCHGESFAHEKDANAGLKKPAKPDVTFDAKSKNTAEQKDKACMTCHLGGNRINWEGSQHANADVACTTCHQVHTQHDAVRDKLTQGEVCFACHKDVRSQVHMSSTHPILAGKVVCSDCHNPHGSNGPKLLRENTVNETCYTCHAEKRGPFLWEHPPVSDDCTNCHTPHGSNNAPLLKSRPPYLCQQCHSAQYHPSTAYSGTGLPITAGGSSPAQQLLLRDCLNCHSQVHGSNHPSGPRNTR